MRYTHRPRPLLRSFAAMALVGVFALPASAGAGTEVPVDPAAPEQSTSGEAGTTPDEAQGEFVQSWTLTPGAGPDGGEVGSRANLSYQVAAGTTIQDTVVLFNLGNVPQEYRVYATDAFNNAAGDFDLLPGDENPTDAGSWVQLPSEVEKIVLQPGRQATIPFVVNVPIDAAPGDHVGAIVASSVSLFDNGGGTMVDVDRRTGTRLYVQVDGPLTPELGIANVTTSYAQAANPLSGSATVSFTLENRGNVRLGGQPVVSIAGPFGLAERRVTLPAIPELLPGERVDLTAELPEVPALFVGSTTVRIDPLDPANVGDIEVVTADDRIFTPPITFLILLLVLIIAWRGYIAVRRHRKAALAAIAAAEGAETVPASEIEVVRHREPQPQ